MRSWKRASRYPSQLGTADRQEPTEELAAKAETYRMTTQEGDKATRRYWTTACGSCSLKKKCTTAPERRIPRWEHEHVLEAAQARLDADPRRCAGGARPSSIRSERLRLAWAPRTS